MAGVGFGVVLQFAEVVIGGAGGEGEGVHHAAVVAHGAYAVQGGVDAVEQVESINGV